MEEIKKAVQEAILQEEIVKTIENAQIAKTKLKKKEFQDMIFAAVLQ